MPTVRFIVALLYALVCLPAASEPNAYIVNEGSGSVSVIETEKDAVALTLKAGQRPRGIVAPTDGSRLYWALEDGTIVEHDLYAKQQSGLGKLGRTPSSIDLSADATLIAAALRDDDKIVLIAPATWRVVKTISLAGKRPTNAVFSPDGRWIYANAEQSAAVEVVDVTQGTVAASIDVGQRLRGIAFLPDGSRALVAADKDGEVAVIDVARRVVAGRIKTASGPSDVAVHPDGKRAFVSASGAGKIQVLDVVAGKVVAEVEVGNGPSSMALTPDGGKLYVVCGPSNEVSVIDTSTYKRIASVAVGNSPTGVVVIEPPPPPDGGERHKRGKRSTNS